jgi:superfamily II DNA or RNA helicase/HKD family nuclease
MSMGSADVLVANLPGQRRMLDVVRGALAGSSEIAISVSFLRFSGLGLVIDEIREFLRRNGRLRLLTSTYMGVTQPDALRVLLGIGGLECKLHVSSMPGLPPTGFHTKMFVFSGHSEECWVGSSNFTKGGLAENIEANLRHAGSEEVGHVRRTFDLLWSRRDSLPLSEKLIDAYQRSLPSGPATAAIPSPIQLEPDGALIELDLSRPWTLFVHSPDRARPNSAQREALERLRLLRAEGEKRAVVIAAPGVGKTFLAAFDAKAMGATSVLFLSNRLEHLSQAERTFCQVFAPGVAANALSPLGPDFVFSTVVAAHKRKYAEDRHFDYVVVDEFHHASANSYRKILDKAQPRFLLGITATPERQDGHDVLELCDYNVAYEVRLPEAINRGWLLPFHYFGVSDDSVNYADVPWRSGRFEPAALENAVATRERAELAFKHAIERGFDGPRRATVGFCAGVRHARFMASEFQRLGQCATSVTGEASLEQREAVYAKFADPTDPLEWLFVADLLNEGVDIPAINSLLFLRPTESATIFVQQLGRGLRLTAGCDVLTIVDLVGHHRAAWLAVSALGDPDAPRASHSVPSLGLTPPRACEIVLDSRTQEILKKVQSLASKSRTRCLETYRLLKAELGTSRPFPIDLLGIGDAPPMSSIRSNFGSWIALRVAADDAESWEVELPIGSAAYRLLQAAELDWQAQRVYPYATLWGMCHSPADPEAGYTAFFDRFPRWKAEFKPLSDSKVMASLEKKLSDLLIGRRLAPQVFDGIPADRLLQEVEGRIRLVLEKDFRQRHGGILRTPSDLEHSRRYSRPEIVNYFGVQYDPARHNSGVLNFEFIGQQHLVIISKIDTSGALEAFQYFNGFESSRSFLWTSQNRQRQDNASGRSILFHGENHVSIHLFVQGASHERAVYCGLVAAESVAGNGPMLVRFRLISPLPAGALEELISGEGFRSLDAATEGEMRPI